MSDLDSLSAQRLRELGYSISICPPAGVPSEDWGHVSFNSNNQQSIKIHPDWDSVNVSGYHAKKARRGLERWMQYRNSREKERLYAEIHFPESKRRKIPPYTHRNKR